MHTRATPIPTCNLPVFQYIKKLEYSLVGNAILSGSKPPSLLLTSNTDLTCSKPCQTNFALENFFWEVSFKFNLFFLFPFRTRYSHSGTSLAKVLFSTPHSLLVYLVLLFYNMGYIGAGDYYHFRRGYGDGCIQHFTFFLNHFFVFLLLLCGFSLFGKRLLSWRCMVFRLLLCKLPSCLPSPCRMHTFAE